MTVIAFKLWFLVSGREGEEKEERNSGEVFCGERGVGILYRRVPEIAFEVVPVSPTLSSMYITISRTRGLP